MTRGTPLDRAERGGHHEVRRESCHTSLPERAVEAVLLRWLELRSGQVRPRGGNAQEGVQRDARAEQIWAATVACAVAACPHNPTRQRWEWVVAPALSRLCRQLSTEDAVEAVQAILPPGALLVPVGEVLARSILAADQAEVGGGAADAAWRRGGLPKVVAQQAAAAAAAWDDVVTTMRRAEVSRRVMAWLARRLWEAAEADSSFLRERR